MYEDLIVVSSCDGIEKVFKEEELQQALICLKETRKRFNDPEDVGIYKVDYQLDSTLAYYDEEENIFIELDG